jgi:hypothetical protein
MVKTKKTTNCIQCGTKTTCKDGICVLCRSGITEINNELRCLLQQKNDCNSLQILEKSKA